LQADSELPQRPLKQADMREDIPSFWNELFVDMNPYYATGFISALYFWVWPAFLYRNLEAHWLTVAFFAALIFLGAGRAASDFHIRFIAPKHPPKGHLSSMVLMCCAIVMVAWLTRVAYDAYRGAQGARPESSQVSLHCPNLPSMLAA
jgi:hypothetical protein